MQIQQRPATILVSFADRTFRKELLCLMPLQALFGEVPEECSTHVRLFHPHKSLRNCRLHPGWLDTTITGSECKGTVAVIAGQRHTDCMPVVPAFARLRVITWSQDSIPDNIAVVEGGAFISVAGGVGERGTSLD